MHDYEVLELLLTYAIPRKDVKPIAKNLMARFKTLPGVLDAPVSEVETVPEMGAHSATLVKLVKEMCGLYLAGRMENKNLLTSPERVVSFARMKLAGLPHEAFMVIFLNVQNEVLAHEIVNEGTVDQVAVYPRRIIEKALARHAAGLIVVHNHPSGYTDPSEEDKRLTRSLKEAAHLLNIRLLDHIIVAPLRSASFGGSGQNGLVPRSLSEGGYFSFLERGLI